MYGKIIQLASSLEQSLKVRATACTSEVQPGSTENYVGGKKEIMIFLCLAFTLADFAKFHTELKKTSLRNGVFLARFLVVLREVA